MSRRRTSQADRPRRTTLSARRKWLFRIIAVTVVPVALLLLAELVLVICGYGTSRSFFTRITGRDRYTTNQTYGWRFFPRIVARQPVPCELADDKPANTYRIFILGGSAAQGTPEPAFAFGRMLEVMLEDNYPRTRFQVINSAMTAINSHVVRQIAADCAKHDPDLFVVYMGNNEVVGPYGPGTVFAGFSDDLSAIRWSIAARSTRLGQLLRDLGVRLGRGENPAAWRGMRMFTRNQLAADDERLDAAYSHFRQNLLDICRMARRANAQVILCTVASNLKDSPPFASLHRTDPAGPQQREWQELFDKGIAFEEAGEHVNAVDAYLSAAKIDDGFAELRFRLARSYLASGDRSKAREHFVAARDLDALRFRADTRINQAIKQVAGEQPDAVHLIDVVEAMSNSNQVTDGIVGNELFHEHVHPNLDGNSLVAAAVFEALSRILPESIRKHSATDLLFPTRRTYARRLAFSDWAQTTLQQQVLDMTSAPPFTDQLDHQLAQDKRQQRVAESAERLASPSARRAALDMHTQALERDPEDPHLAVLLASLLSQTGDHSAASQHYRQLLRSHPDSGRWQIELGTSLARQGKPEEAVTWLKQGLRQLSNDPAGHVNLGIALMQTGRMNKAVRHFRRVLAFEPDHFTAHSNLGVALLNMAVADEAAVHLKRALELDDTGAGSHFNMGLALLALEKPDGAANSFRNALKLDPNHRGAKERLESLQPQRKDTGRPSP